MGRARATVTGGATGGQLRSICLSDQGIKLNALQAAIADPYSLQNCHNLVETPKGKQFVWTFLDTVMATLKSTEDSQGLKQLYNNVALLNHQQTEITKQQLWDQLSSKPVLHPEQKLYEDNVGTIEDGSVANYMKLLEYFDKFNPDMDLEPVDEEFDSGFEQIAKSVKNYPSPYTLPSLGSKRFTNQSGKRINGWSSFQTVELFLSCKNANTSQAVENAKIRNKAMRFKAARQQLALASWMATYSAHKGKISMHDLEEDNG